jgi:hypothetical protein
VIAAYGGDGEERSDDAGGSRSGNPLVRRLARPLMSYQSPFQGGRQRSAATMQGDHVATPLARRLARPPCLSVPL